MVLLLSALCLVLLISWLPTSAANLLVNGDFEAGYSDTGLPIGWPQLYGNQSVWGETVRDSDEAYGGKGALLIDDKDSKVGYGIRSTRIPAIPGHEYRVSAYIMGGGALYLEFWNAKGQRTNTFLRGPGGSTWANVEVLAVAPEDAVTVSVLLYTYSSTVAQCRYDNVELVDLSSMTTAQMPQEEFAASLEQLDYAPADGAFATTNPASFIWVPVVGAASYQLEVSTTATFSADTTQRISNIDISIYTPAQAMDTTQTYYWRVRAVLSSGATLPWSNVRSFNYDRNAAVMPLPDLETLRARIPTTHPRLFVRPDTLTDFRDLQKQFAYRIIVNNIRTSVVMQSLQSLPTEPPSCYMNGKRDISIWSSSANQGQATMSAIERMAFYYMLTEDAAIGQVVRDWMLTVASWDPKGATSAAINDEISMPIMYQMSRAYTWAYSALSPEDREIIRNNIRIRGAESYKILRDRPFESRPYGSHPGRQLGFLGEVAIAFMDEIPEAAEWFDYVVRIFYAVYPAWGGDEGGWAEGQAYWTSYINRVMWFADAFYVATGLNLYDKPFFQNNGYFKLYTQPPYSKMGPFGDHADEPPTATVAGIMSHYAGLYQNPYFKWYAQELPVTLNLTPMYYIRQSLANPTEVAVKPPTDLPQARYFADIGWVAMHRNLADADENVQFMLKSSPYGSFSHSLADQNSFTIEAYGEPLAISSGYRPWYGSNHHLNWTKQTKAHNSILINGTGQPIQSLAAKGNIRSFVHGASFDYAVGDAQQAYPQASRFLRHVVYIRPDVFVMFDDVAAQDGAVTYDWLLHAYQQMQVDEQNSTVTIPGKNASLTVRFFTPQSLKWTQTNQFDVPLDTEMDKPVQWHLKATTLDAAQEQVFLTTLVATKAGADASKIQARQIPVAGGYGLEVDTPNSQTVVLFRQESAASNMQGGRVQGDALVLAATANADKLVTGLLMVAGTELKVDGRTWLQASQPVEAEMTYADAAVTGSITTTAQTQLWITVPAATTTLLLDGVAQQLHTQEIAGQWMAILDLPVRGTYQVQVIAE